MRISIAMATYNGEQYLAEQLASLAGQRLLPYELVVCDDGSTDETLEILAEFSKKAPFKVRIYRNESNLGFADNFFKAARLCSGEWIAFCDQDDVWLPNKLYGVVQALELDSRANLVLQTAFLCNEKLEREGRIFPAQIAPGYHQPRSQYGFWVWPGFLQTFRASFLRDIETKNRPRNYYPGHATMSHDKWTCMLANATGGMLVLSEPAALYRRHSSALTGPYAVQSWRERIDKALPVGGEHYKFLSKIAKETADYLNNISDYVQPSQSEDLRESAKRFVDIAEIQLERADMYDSRQFLTRICCFVRIAMRGGYVGPAMIALGWKSGLKDIIWTFGLLKRLQKSGR